MPGGSSKPSTTEQHWFSKGIKETLKYKISFIFPERRIFRPSMEGVAWAEFEPLYWFAPRGWGEGRGWLGFSRFVFIFSTSKLYKNMQHTSWPKSMWN